MRHEAMVAWMPPQDVFGRLLAGYTSRLSRPLPVPILILLVPAVTQ